FDVLDRRFFEYPDDISALLVAYIESETTPVGSSHRSRSATVADDPQRMGFDGDRGHRVGIAGSMTTAGAPSRGGPRHGPRSWAGAEPRLVGAAALRGRGPGVERLYDQRVYNGRGRKIDQRFRQHLPAP